MDNRTKNLTKNTAVLTFGNLCTKGVMFIMTPLFTRWVSQSDYGTFDLLITYLSLLIPLITLDIGEGCFRFLIGDNINNDSRKTISVTVVTFVIGLIAAFFIAILLSLLMPAYKTLILLYYFMLATEVCYNFFTVTARGLRKLAVYAEGSIIYVIIMAACSIVFVYYLKMGINGLLLSYGIGYLCSCVFMAIRCGITRYVSLKEFDEEHLKIMCKYSLPMLPNALAWWVMNVSDRTLVSLFIGTEATAVLAVANKLPNLCQQLFKQFHLSWQETAVDTLNSKDRDAYFSDIFNKLFQLMASLIILILSFNFIFYDLLFTEEYSFGYYLTPILLVAIMIYMMTQFLGGIYIAQMNSVKNGRSTVIAAAINLVIDLILLPLIGLWAAVISTLIAYFALFIIRYRDIAKEIHLRLSSRSIVLAIVLIYFTASNYFNLLPLNIVNIIVAFLIFFLSNRKMIASFLENYLRRNKNE